MKKFTKLKRFFRYFKPHRKLLILDLTCATLSALIGIAFPLVIDYALNNLLQNKQLKELFVLAIVIVVAYLLNTVFVFVVGYYGHTLGTRVEADIRQDLFNHMQKLSNQFYDKNRVGGLMSRITTDLFEMTELAHHGPEDALICNITIIGSMIAMFYLNWRLAICVSLILVITVMFILSQEKANMKCAKSMKVELADIHTELETSISGIRVTKAFANENFENQRFAKSNNKFKNAKREFFKHYAIYSSGMDLIKNSMSISVIIVGSILYIKGYATFVNIITFNLFTMVLLMPIQKLVDFSEIYLGGVAGFSRFIEIMEEEPEIEDKLGALVLEKPKGDVVFQNVSFGYEKDRNVLHNINLEIRNGMIVALVGPSGAGKTTICQLLPRFYEINQGKITIDGHDIRDITLHSLRSNIGFVQQEVFIFSDTVMENIRYGSHDKSDEEVIAAAKMAEMHDDIMAMENGYQTYVGEKGAMLSGGQKQRLSIARMFLKNPPIIILDEATSALDSVTEYKIQGAIDRLSKGHTMIIVAHRLSTIRNADLVAVIDQGTIVEMGTHEELLDLKGQYAKFNEVQYYKKSKEWL